MIRERTRGVLALVAVTALWGVSFPLVGEAVAGRSPGQVLYFLFLRFGLATLSFLPITRAVVRKARGKGFRPWGLSLTIGALFFVAFLLQSLGLQHTDPSRSAFVTVLSVPMVPFLAALVHRRRPSRVHQWSSLVATGGIALVLAPGGRLEPNLGDWLTLASAFVFAVEILLLEYVTRRAPTLIVTVGQIAGVALFAALALACVPFELPESWPGLWQGVLVTGLVCTTLALGGMTWGQARVGAEVAAVIFALEPIFAALFVWVLGGAGLGPLQSAGGLVVFAAVAWSARVPVDSRS
jgi:drug/metabolite transporter (DMT)-like permease